MIPIPAPLIVDTAKVVERCSYEIHLRLLSMLFISRLLFNSGTASLRYTGHSSADIVRFKVAKDQLTNKAFGGTQRAIFMGFISPLEHRRRFVYCTSSHKLEQLYLVHCCDATILFLLFVQTGLSFQMMPSLSQDAKTTCRQPSYMLPP